MQDKNDFICRNKSPEAEQSLKYTDRTSDSPRNEMSIHIRKILVGHFSATVWTLFQLKTFDFSLTVGHSTQYA